MATVTERLALIIDADAKGAVRELSALGSTAERELARPQDRLDRISSNLTKTGVAAVAAGGTIAVGLRAAADATQDLADSTDKAKAVFGDTTALDRFAEGAAKAMGKSKAAALDAASVYGNVGKAAGVGGAQLTSIATALATRTADLAEQQKKSYAEVESAIVAGLNGRGKALKQLGVDLSDARLQEVAYASGIAESGSKLTAQQKYLAAYRTILDQTASAQGFFAKSTDDLGVAQEQANAAFENAKAALGEAALPAMTALTGVATDLLDTFNELPRGVQSVVGSIVTAGAGLAVAGGAISTVVGQSIKAVQWVRNASAARAEAASAGVAAAQAEIAAVQALTAAQAKAATAAAADAAAQARLAEVTIIASTTQAEYAAALSRRAALALTAGTSAEKLAAAEAEVAATSSAAAAAQARLATVTNTAAAASERAAIAAASEAEAQTAAAAASVGAASKVGGAWSAVKAGLGKLALGAFITDSIFGFVNGLTDVDAEMSSALTKLQGMVESGADDIVRTFNDKAAEAERGSLKWSHLITAITDNNFKLGGTGVAQNVSDMKEAFDKLLATDPAAAQRLVDSVRELDKGLSKNDTNRVQSESLVRIWQKAIDDATGSQKASTSATDDGTSALDDNTDALKDNAAARKDVSATDIVNDYLDLAEANNRLAEAQKSSTDAAADQADAIRSVAKANRDLASSRRDLADKQADLRDVQGKIARVDPAKNPNLYRDLQDQLRNALNDVADAQDRVADASDGVASAEDDLRGARDDGQKAADDARQAEIDLARARLAQVAAAEKLASDSAALAANPQTAKDEIARIAQLRDAGLIDKASADALIGQLLKAIAGAQGSAKAQDVAATRGKQRDALTSAGVGFVETPTGNIVQSGVGGGRVPPAELSAFLNAFPKNPKRGDTAEVGGKKFGWNGQTWVELTGLFAGLAFADGGRVPGAGNTDSVNAKVMPGEFIIRKDAARAIGIDQLERLNQADSWPKFAAGGPVGFVPPSASPIGVPVIDPPRGGDGGSTDALLAELIAILRDRPAGDINLTVDQRGYERPPQPPDTARAVRSGMFLAGRR